MTEGYVTSIVVLVPDWVLDEIKEAFTAVDQADLDEVLAQHPGWTADMIVGGLLFATGLAPIRKL